MYHIAPLPIRKHTSLVHKKQVEHQHYIRDIASENQNRLQRTFQPNPTVSHATEEWKRRRLRDRRLAFAARLAHVSLLPDL
jgi:hypothetical protein